MTVEDARKIAYPDQLYSIFWRNAGGRKWIRRGDIIDYFDDTFASSVELWHRWKLFGLPNGGGWMGERPTVVQAIEVVEAEKNLYESRTMEEARKKRGS